HSALKLDDEVKRHMADMDKDNIDGRDKGSEEVMAFLDHKEQEEEQDMHGQEASSPQWQENENGKGGGAAGEDEVKGKSGQKWNEQETSKQPIPYSLDDVLKKLEEDVGYKTSFDIVVREMTFGDKRTAL